SSLCNSCFFNAVNWQPACLCTVRRSTRPETRRRNMACAAASGPWMMGATPGRFQVNLPFCNLKGEALAQFVAIAPEVSRSRGESLFHEGEIPQYVFVVCSGKIKLSVCSREGKTAILRIAGPGEILGLSAAMSGVPHETSAEGLELCRVKAIRVKDFLRFLQK